MPEAPPRHACLLLAAGLGRRMGRDKALLPHPQGGTLIEHMTAAALATEPVQMLVVRRPGQPLPVLAPAVERLDCCDADEGMAASLRCGIGALLPHIEGVMILLLDQPALDAGHLRRLHSRWVADPEQAVAFHYADLLGVPAVLPRSWFPALLELRGDCGARELLRGGGMPVAALAAPELALDWDG